MLIIKCGHCGTLNTVTTSKQHKTGKRGPVAYDVNTRLALGSLNAGIGQTHVNALLSCLNIPSINHVTFKTRGREVGKAVETVAKASCMESCNEERESAVAAGAKYNNNNLVGVTCSYDLGWQKGGRPTIRPPAMEVYLGSPLGKCWIILREIKCV